MMMSLASNQTSVYVFVCVVSVILLFTELWYQMVHRNVFEIDYASCFRLCRKTFDSMRPEFSFRAFSGFFGGLKFLIFVKYLQISWGMLFFRIKDAHFFDVDVQGKPYNVIVVDMAYFCLPMYAWVNFIFLHLYRLYAPSYYYWYRRAVLLFLIVGLNPYNENAFLYMAYPVIFSFSFFIVFGLKLILLGLYHDVWKKLYAWYWTKVWVFEKQSREYAHSKREFRRKSEEDKERRRKKKKEDQRFKDMNRLTRQLTIIDNREQRIKELEGQLDVLAETLAECSVDESSSELNKYHKVQLRLTKMREGQQKAVSDIVSSSKRLISNEVYVGKPHSGSSDLLSSIVDCLQSVDFDGPKVMLGMRIVSRLDHFRLCSTPANYGIFMLGLIAEFVPPEVINSCYEHIVTLIQDLRSDAPEITQDKHNSHGEIVLEDEDKDVYIGEKQSLSSIISAVNHPLGGIVKKLIGLTIVLSLSYGCINRENLHKIVEVGLDIPKKVEEADALKYVCAAVKYVYKSLPLTSDGIDWTLLWQGTTKQQRYVKKFAELKYQTELHTNGDPNRFNDEQIIMPIRDLVAQLGELKENVSSQLKFKQGSDLSKLQRDYLLIDSWHKAMEEKLTRQCITESPAVYVATGSPGTGKTMFLQYVLAICMKAAGIESGPEHIGVFNPNDKFDMHAGKNAMIIDDMLQVDPMCAETNEPLVLIHTGNPTITMATMPGLEQKGRVILNPRIIGCTSNSVELEPTGYIKHPDAFKRRFNLVFEVFVKPEFCLPESSQIDGKKALGNPNVWQFRAGYYVIPASKKNPPPRASKFELDANFNLVPAGNGHLFDLVSFSKYLADSARNYYENQRAMVKIARRIGKEYCHHVENGQEYDFIPGACPICNKKEIVAIDPTTGQPTWPAADNKSTTDTPQAKSDAEDGTTPNVAEPKAEKNDDVSDAAEPKVEGVIEEKNGPFVGTKQSRVVFDFAYIFILSALSSTAVFGFWTFRYIYGLGIPDGVWYMFGDIMSYMLTVGSGWRFGAMYLTSLFGHFWYKSRVVKVVDKFPSRFVRHVYNFCFVTTSVFMIEGVIWIFKNGRRRSVLLFKSLVNRVKHLCVKKVVTEVKSFLQTYQTRIAIILAVAAVVVVIKLVPQGSVQFGKQPDTWSPAIPHEIVLNGERTTSFEDAMRIMKNNLVSIRCIKGIKTIEGNAIPYKGNYYLTNAHNFDTFPDFIQITRRDIRSPQSNYKQRMCEDFVHIIPDTDIAVVFLPRCMRNRDMSKFFTNKMPTASRCVMVYKDPYGNLDEKSVYAVAQPSTDNIKTHIRKSFVYVRDVFPGLCGAMLITSTKFPTIIGMHWAGNMETRTGCSTFLDKDLIENAIVEIEKKLDIMPFALPSGLNKYISPEPIDEDYSYVKLGPQGNLTYVGMSKVAHTHEKSYVIRTELYDDLQPKVGVDVYRPVMNPHWKAVFEKQKNLAYKSDSIHMPPHLLLIAYDDLKCKIADMYQSEPDFRDCLQNLRVLSFDEGMNGTGAPGMEKMKLDSSMGMSEVRNGGKKSLEFTKDPTGRIIPPEGFEDIVKNLENDYAAGKTNYVPWREHKKDEVRTKIKDARIFSSCPVEFLVLMRMYFLPLCGLIRRFSEIFETVIGMNVYGPQWDALAKVLLVMSSNRLAYGDYKFYDQSVTPEEAIFAFKFLIFLTYFSNHITNAQRAIMWALASDVIYPMYVGNGHAYLSSGDIPSGVMITVILNNIVNMLRHRVVYYAHNRHVAIPAFPHENPDLFHKHVAAFFLGDDCITSCDDYVELSPEIMAKTLRAFGITYTDAESKGEVTSGYGTLEGASFLKRKFRKIEGVDGYVAPLDKASIFKPLLACIPSKSVTPAQQLADAISTASREMLFHGKTEYDNFVNLMREVTAGKAVEQLITEDAFEPYESKLARWRETYFSQFSSDET